VPTARSSLGSPATDVPDRRALIHRRRRNLLAGALAAFAIGIAAGAMSGDEEEASAPVTPTPDRAAPPASEPDGSDAAPVDELSLAQQVGQLIVLRFAGTTPPDYVREALRERRAAGAILFRDNVADPAQLRTLTRALRRAGGRPIVAVDQEGGEIRIVPWAPPAAAAPEQEAAGSVRADAEAAGAALRGLGITVSLAPVGDVPSVSGAALGGRAFATEPDAVGDAMAAAVQGWRAGGVAATAKHFPGLGGAAVNTDDGPATIERSRAQLEATDLPPFAAAIEAGVPLVMVGHARYPALDPDRIASQSQPIIQQLLRERMRFRGVVVTDSMEARASLATGAITTVSERAIRAGGDLLLLTGRGSYAPVYQHLLALARQSPAFRARVRESAARVLALKRDAASP
jgi:beta-N-acetylhexosaminidase